MSASAPADAARLDDIAPPRHLRLELEWAQPGGRDATGLHRMRARAPGVEYLLDTRPYRGRMARIYYVLPLDAAGLTSPFGLRVSWQARGELRSGEGRAGARVLVYEGRIDTPRIQAFFDLDLEVDSRYFAGTLRFDPYFEIDVQ